MQLEAAGGLVGNDAILLGGVEQEFGLTSVHRHLTCGQGAVVLLRQPLQFGRLIAHVDAQGLHVGHFGGVEVHSGHQRVARIGVVIAVVEHVADMAAGFGPAPHVLQRLQAHHVERRGLAAVAVAAEKLVDGLAKFLGSILAVERKDFGHLAAHVVGHYGDGVEVAVEAEEVAVVNPLLNVAIMKGLHAGSRQTHVAEVHAQLLETLQEGHAQYALVVVGVHVRQFGVGHAQRLSGHGELKFVNVGRGSRIAVGREYAGTLPRVERKALAAALIKSFNLKVAVARKAHVGFRRSAGLGPIGKHQALRLNVNYPQTRQGRRAEQPGKAGRERGVVGRSHIYGHVGQHNVAQAQAVNQGGTHLERAEHTAHQERIAQHPQAAAVGLGLTDHRDGIARLHHHIVKSVAVNLNARHHGPLQCGRQIAVAGRTLHTHAVVPLKLHGYAGITLQPARKPLTDRLPASAKVSQLRPASLPEEGMHPGTQAALAPLAVERVSLAGKQAVGHRSQTPVGHTGLEQRKLCHTAGIGIERTERIGIGPQAQRIVGLNQTHYASTHTDGIEQTAGLCAEIVERLILRAVFATVAVALHLTRAERLQLGKLLQMDQGPGLDHRERVTGIDGKGTRILLEQTVNTLQQAAVVMPLAGKSQIAEQTGRRHQLSAILAVERTKRLGIVTGGQQCHFSYDTVGHCGLRGGKNT